MNGFDPFAGSWTYRSFLNDPDLHVKDGSADFNAVQFGYGILQIDEAPGQLVTGSIGYAADGWSLNIHGSKSFGSPMEIRFQGKGIVSGSEWIYDYVGWLVPVWPGSTRRLQREALVGSIVRTVPHPNGSGGVSPAGVVGSWYAVRADAGNG
ncbi:MAG TPA: hypothetical protein VHG51_04450 [Longimicrobiaceae bacterium]|nr:hypothetical protein [Longimicrobiaceae bacterium]